MNRISALGDTIPVALLGPGLEISDRGVANMISVAAWPGQSDALCLEFANNGIDLPRTSGSVTETATSIAMAVAPRRWLVEIRKGNGPKIDPDLGSVTDLGHARSSYILSGPDAVVVAQKLAPVDFDLAAYGIGKVCQTGSGHTVALTIWRQAKDRFVIYVERAYGRDFWHNLQAESAEFGVA